MHEDVCPLSVKRLTGLVFTGRSGMQGEGQCLMSHTCGIREKERDRE